MQTHKLNEKAIAVTGLPEGAMPINIGYNTEGVFLWYKFGHRNYQLRLKVDLPFRRKIGWKVLGFAQSLTDADRAVYEQLLQSNGLYLINPFPNPEATKVLGASPSGSDYEILDELREQWQSAQLLTNPLILIRE